MLNIIVFILLLFSVVFANEEKLYVEIGIESPNREIDIIIPSDGLNELIPLFVISYYAENGATKTTIIKELTPKDFERILKGKTVKKGNLNSFLRREWIVIEDEEQKIQFPKEFAQNIVELFQGKKLSINEVINKEYKIQTYEKEGITTTSFKIIKKHPKKSFTLQLENENLNTYTGFLSILMLSRLLFEYIDKDKQLTEIKEEDLALVPANVKKNLKRKIDFSKIFQIFYEEIEIKSRKK
jgi:hypothetical protein